MRRWVPWVLRAARAAELAARGAAVLRDELLAAQLSLEEQEALTLSLYQRSSTYAPGGSAFEQGLFPWEARVFSGPLWPERGRVLVGAAGAGREALALARRGHGVVAFEPCGPLVEQGLSGAKAHGFELLRGSYAGLIAAALERRGPLLSLAEGPPFDAVVLGWGSLSHVLDPSQRARLLQALARVAPGAPVLMSFLATWPRGAGEQRLRARLRKFLRAGEAPHFSPDAGFFHLFAREEIEALAAGASYRIAEYREDPYPHAVLTSEVSSRRP